MANDQLPKGSPTAVVLSILLFASLAANVYFLFIK